MTEETQYASEDDLGPDEDVTTVSLPELKKAVRVRRLGTRDMTQLSLLPNLLGEPDDAVDPNGLLENIDWWARLAHVSVIKSEKPGEPVKCESCGLSHPPVLWSLTRTKRLRTADLIAIANEAIDALTIETVRPLSQENTPSDSPELVTSGG